MRPEAVRVRATRRSARRSHSPRCRLDLLGQERTHVRFLSTRPSGRSAIGSARALGAFRAERCRLRVSERERPPRRCRGYPAVRSIRSRTPRPAEHLGPDSVCSSQGGPCDSTRVRPRPRADQWLPRCAAPDRLPRWVDAADRAHRRRPRRVPAIRARTVGTRGLGRRGQGDRWCGIVDGLLPESSTLKQPDAARPGGGQDPGRRPPVASTPPRPLGGDRPGDPPGP